MLSLDRHIQSLPTHSYLLATTNLFISITLAFQECHVNETIQYVTF